MKTLSLCNAALLVTGFNPKLESSAFLYIINIAGRKLYRGWGQEGYGGGGGVFA